jgi:6,7-dimethyl-8-ribityllumazine synthase
MTAKEENSMPKVIEGQLSASGKKFAIVVSRFNELICKKLLEGALDCLKRHGGDLDQVTIAWVPGAFEIPVAAKRIARSGEYDAVICLGAVIRGATPHFEYIAAEVTKGIAQASMELEVPVSYGVITPDNLEQALERAGTKAGNKGWDAAMSAIEMADLFTHIKG